MDGPRVGVLLVGGFLGAGKTTLLRRLVRDRSVSARIAVLVNELGALGIDGELISEARQTAALRTVQLDSGCLCCTLRGELGEALHELARPSSGPAPEQIIVELSGAALASEVHFQVATQALDAPYYADGLVCVVDARLAPRWARDAEELFVDQLTRADLVLSSKRDLATAAEQAETDALVARVAPGARVVTCTRGEIDPALLLGLRADAPAAAPDEHGHGHTHALRSETILFDAPLDRAALEQALEALAPALFRIKGLVDVRDAAGVVPTWVQCVGDQIELVPASPGDAPRRLVFIGPTVDRAHVIATLVGRRSSSYC